MTFSWQSTAWSDGLTLSRSLTRCQIPSTPSLRRTGDLLVMAAFGQADEVGR